MRRVIFYVATCLFFTGCTTQQFEERILGKHRDLVEPKSNFALVTFEAPTLTKFMWEHDTIKIKFYESCTDAKWGINEGYIGGLRLSTKSDIGNKKTIKVPADHPILLEIGHMAKVQCTGKFIWTPSEGKHYKFEYNLDGWSCNAFGVELKEDGGIQQISGLESFKNKDGFFSTSGSTAENWRKCSKIGDPGSGGS